ncbi:MAG: hypothetical protein P0121_17420 [Nitrospira sp.]|nr:hypothetical protein [Nitrospira sp.]
MEVATRALNELITRHSGRSVNLTSDGDKTLFVDYGINGLDGKVFLDDYAAMTGMDLSTVSYTKYFGREVMGGPVFSWKYFIHVILKGGEPHKVLGLTPIRVSDLCRMTISGVWDI